LIPFGLDFRVRVEGVFMNTRHLRWAMVTVSSLTLAGAVAAQSITEYPVSDVPTAVAAGPDGNVWFVLRPANKIAKITPAGTVTEYAVPAQNPFLGGITTGPDGRIWFTEIVANAVGRFDPVSQIFQEFPVQTPDSAPAGIAAGPDGNVWFTESNAPTIGKIDPATGVITEYPIAVAPLHRGRGIVAGADGAMWFTENEVHRVGRIDMAGAVAEYDVPGVVQLDDIVAGPDGALWFPEFFESKIGRITTAGELTEFVIPETGGALPGGLAAGPDGNLWFTEFAQNKIGRLTPAGAISYWTVPTASCAPGHIAAGPDGALWFTEEAVNPVPIKKLGRITTGSSCLTITLSPSTLPEGAAGIAYTPTTVTPSGGTGPYTFHVPGLPAGMTPTSAVVGPDVTIGGTPAAGFSGPIHVVGTDANGCPFDQTYSLFIDPGVTVASITPGSGPATGGTAVGIDGTDFQSAATVTIGGQTAGGIVVSSSTHIAATTPANSPGTLNDVTVTNADSSTGTLAEAFFADFLDVPQGDPFHGVIEKLVRRHATAGCGAGYFCRDYQVYRGEAMVLLLAAKYGPGWVPPPVIAPVFTDLPIVATRPWIEEARVEGITAGCGPTTFCPYDSVDRKTMAVFLLVAKHGAGYQPPAATGIFLDVPVGAPLAAWVDELGREGITTGCGSGYFCPNLSVLRKQLAAFLVATFGF